MNWLLVSLLAAFAVGGTFRGFVRSVFSLFSFVIALLLAFSITPSLSNKFIDQKFLYQPISSVVESVVGGIDENFNSVEFSDKTEMESFVKSADIPLYAKSVLSGIIQKIDFSGSFTVSQIVTGPLYSAGMKIISFVILAVGIYVIMKIIQYFVVKKIKLPFLKVTDRVLGFIFGVVLGVVVYLFMVCVMLAISQFILSEWIIKKIESGYLSSIFYERYGEDILAKLYSLF